MLKICPPLRAASVKRGHSGSLVSATQFDEGTCWRGTLVPAAGEWSACFGSVAVVRGVSSDAPSDLEKGAKDRLRRAQKRIRRFAVANRLNRLITLTFEFRPESDRVAVGEVSRFFRRVTYRFPRVPYVWTLEFGEQTRRVHAHALVGGLDATFLDSKWPLGRTDHVVYDLDATSLRTAAGYLANDLDRGPLHGGQAYRVAKGFQPEGISLRGLRDPRSVIWEASHLMGADPTSVDDSARGASLTAYWDV